MEKIVVAILHLLVFLISWGMLRLTWGPFQFFKLPYFFALLYSLTIYGGAIAGILTGMYTNSFYWLVVPLFFFLFSFNGYVMARLSGVTTGSIEAYVHRPIEDDLGIPGILFVLLGCLVCILVYLLYLKMTDGAGTKILFEKMTFAEMAELRNSATTMFRTKKLNIFGYFSGVFKGVLPVLSLFVMLYFAGRPQRRGFFCGLFFVIFFSCTIILLSLLIKAEFVKYWVLVAITFGVIRQRFAFLTQVSLMVVLILLPMGFMYGLYSLSGNTENVLVRVLVGMGNRMTMTYNNLLHLTFEIFPSRFEFLGGVSMPNPLGILPFTPVNFSYVLYDVYKPLSQVRGSAPTVFFAEVYANFGMLGCVSSMLFVSFFVNGCYLFFLQVPKTISSVALYAFVTLTVAQLAVGSLWGVLLSWPSIAGVATVLTVVAVSNSWRYLKSSSNNRCAHCVPTR
ncbi:hypothetical protein ACUUL3_05355 [Thiovibrio sp. JS02]